MEQLIGREKEIATLQKLITSPAPELLAIYGRRRIGKTFLIRKTFEDKIAFEFVGANNISLKEQLGNFTKALIQYGATMLMTAPTDWSDAFYLLSQFLEPKLTKGKLVVFLDEFPWMNSKRSGFLAAFDHWWNSWGNKKDNLVVVICGSSAAWMIRHIVNNKGGLHNRITRRIKLQPFSLKETAAFLQSKKIQLGHYQIVQLYMALGGIPQYLKEIQRGESTAQTIDRLCFNPNGPLLEEFNNLYQSLFDNATRYVELIKILARKNNGLARSEILKALNLPSGGSLTRMLEELEASDFIKAMIPFEHRSKEKVYKVADEFSLFYLKFMENKLVEGPGSWNKLSARQTWKSWSGLAFERICLKHIDKIKEALGLSAIYTESSAWKGVHPESTGAQVDLVIDRADYIINLCEIKFSDAVFTIDKKYASELRNKQSLFKALTKTRKNIFLVLITTFGAYENEYYTDLIQNQITVDALF